jgi:hypothetical protein
MELVFKVFGFVADGYAGRRLARCAGLLASGVLAGLALKLGAAEWVLQEYIDYTSSAAREQLQDVVDRISLPTTTMPE